MHPLDSSLDTSLHDQPRVPMRRRTSIDNGCLATNGELMLKLISSTSNADVEYHRHTLRPRRLSLNNVNALPTTFLASLNTSTFNTKTDLDLDCHSSLHGNLHTSSSRRSSRHSKTSGHRHGTQSTAGSNSNRAAGTDEPMTVSDDNDSFNSDNDDDSFCDASFAEPANQDYIQRDLGASCLWDDEDFFRQVEHEGSSGIKDMDSNDNISDYDYHYGEEPTKGGGTDHTSRNSTINSQPAMGEDDHDDDDDIAVRSRNSHKQRRGQANNFHDDSLSGGFDDDSSEDSFCDADDFERANKEYLKTDLGASVFWNSKDMIDMDVDNTCSGAGIETISEAEELGDH